MKTTKGGKVMNPTDAYRKQIRKREIKRAPNENDWIEKTRGQLVVAATVIGAMGFELMVNPPGGVWQSKECGSNEYCTVPGTSILADDKLKRPLYLGMLISSIVSFSASMSLILLLVSGLGLGNRFIMAIMKLLMIIAVLCVSAAFCCSMVMIHNAYFFMYPYFGIWAVLALVVLVMYGIRLIFPKRQSTMRV